MTTVARLLHTPVKSLKMGEVDQLVLHERGVVDDRVFFLVDDTNQSLNQARRLPLCQATATFDGEILSIVLPDGSLVVGDTPTGERFTAGFDMKSTIEATLVPGPWGDALSEWAGEPVRLARAADGRGGWSGFAASLIGTPSIDALGLGPIDARRFRMMIQTVGGAPFEEDAWIGRDIRVGEAVVRVVEECIRCAVTTVDPDSGERDVDALRAMITAKGEPNLGIYCDVIDPGTIRIGDPVQVI
ncbi:MAG: MOSC domain-containing protein [Actinobacteria bacterium]|nr:MOSC domain-containing protein [Actinomycetota bacterium]